MSDSNDDAQNNAPLQPDSKDVKQDPSDQLTPDHPRFKEVVAEKNQLKETVEEMKTQMEELKTSINQRQDQTGDDELTYEEEKALDKIQKGLKTKYGILTEEDLRTQRRRDSYDRLAGKHDGTNGLPKFVPVDVEAYAKANGFGDNLEAAYKDMHFEAIVSQEAKKKGEQVTPPSSEKPGKGEREIVASEFTPEAISAMSDEEYEKNRSKILTSLRQTS